MAANLIESGSVELLGKPEELVVNSILGFLRTASAPSH